MLAILTQQYTDFSQTVAVSGGRLGRILRSVG